MLSAPDAVAHTRDLLAIRAAEAETLDNVHKYLHGEQALPVVVQGAPVEVRRLAAMSRINICRLPVETQAQRLFVTGFRDADSAVDDPAWMIWQANKMDRRQNGLHRAALAYNASYTVVLPGEPHSVIRCVSPRRMTAVYGTDPDWPMYALEVDGDLYRLYDDEAVYTLYEDRDNRDFRESYTPKFIMAEVHAQGVCPVVRYRASDDLDGEDSPGEVRPLMPLQDQLDETTFGLLTAQHFQAFRQRYVIGWTTPDETTKAKAAASRLWTFDDPDITIGEFSQVALDGYHGSRSATLEMAAMISQTPPHHLLGKMVNLSAEALAAAESGASRKSQETETNFGESHEQTLRLAARAEGIDVSDGAQVVWRDTEARSLAATVDALGKMVQMLGIPPEVVWERIPGWTPQDSAAARAALDKADAFGNLAALLAGADAPETNPLPDAIG